MAKNLKDLDFILCGLGFTSRTETVEDYLKDKVGSLTVVGISSCFLKENLSYCRYYEAGELKREFRVPNIRIKDYKWYRQPMMPFVVLMYFVSICYAMIKLRKSFDVYLGVSHTFGLFGVILKKLGAVKDVIYYCIDYYIPAGIKDFHNIFSLPLLNWVDGFTARNSAFVWDLSSRIPEYRESIGKVKAGSYKEAVVPLGYSRQARTYKPFEEADRWRIGFVGSVTANQGLQLLLEAMPDIIKELPDVRVTIIGQGPYLSEFKSMVSRSNMDRYFDFRGFIKDEKAMLDILSGSAIAVALYSDSIENKNIVCADVGKPKLYAVCGLPIITTKVCRPQGENIDIDAWRFIDYRKEDLKEAVCFMMKDPSRLKRLREQAFALGERFIADSIFDKAIVQLHFN
jgi:glycosyltransferase involved in cell wall biosynthesis